uniref:Uncharacterized protein n=1 Tax=Periophthalmus magnuspinnatus TaxID=409849 RepID=A0A3B4A2R7_9GOBI
ICLFLSPSPCVLSLRLFTAPSLSPYLSHCAPVFVPSLSLSLLSLFYLYIFDSDRAGAARYTMFGLLFTGPHRLFFATGWRDFERKMKSFWTLFQFVNVHFVPVQFRVMFANVSAFKNLASVRKGSH